MRKKIPENVQEKGKGDLHERVISSHPRFISELPSAIFFRQAFFSYLISFTVSFGSRPRRNLGFRLSEALAVLSWRPSTTGGRKERNCDLKVFVAPC